MAKEHGPSPVEIAHALKGIDLPADRQQLVRHARGNRAGQEITSLLERLPEQQYRTMAEVEKAVGELA